MNDSLNYDVLEKYLKTRYLGRRVVYLETTTSTNDIIKNYGDEGIPEGLIVIAEEQTKGRGRVGKRWSTPRGEAIAVSMLLRPNIKPSDAPSITPLLAVSVVQAIRGLTDIDTGIKWPNDIVLDKRKLCGILTEMKMASDGSFYIVVGMGLNVNQTMFDNDIEDIAISLKKYTGSNHNRAEVLSAILNSFENNYEIFKVKGISAFTDIMRKFSMLLGKSIEVVGSGETFRAIAMDIEPDGALIVRKEDGMMVKVLSGEITIKGYYRC